MLEIQRTNQELLEHPKYSRKGWIGVDLDGTLARSDSGKDPRYIGAPVHQMLERVRYWIKTGRAVKIFTARAGNVREEYVIHQWCVRHGLPKLEITNRKDHAMIALWDDRAVGVVKNKGVPILPIPMTLWQALRLRLLQLVGGGPVMKVDRNQLRGQFQAAQEFCLDLIKENGLESNYSRSEKPVKM
jgi:hypothetical protein